MAHRRGVLDGTDGRSERHPGLEFAGRFAPTPVQLSAVPTRPFCAAHRLRANLRPGRRPGLTHKEGPLSIALKAALLLSLSSLDWLGAVDRADMYSALIVDASDETTARRVLAAAYNDPAVTWGQWRDLKLDYMRSHGPPYFLAYSSEFAPVCEASR